MATTRATGALWRIATTRMPTKCGMFEAIGFERDVSNGSQRVETAFAIVLGDVTTGAPLLRIHSQCFTGEVLGSLRCDCAGQLEMAMQAIAEEGRGLVIYEYQEGRGIGLMAKLEAYELQDAGLDTVQANHALGLEADLRNYDLSVAMLRDLGVSQVRLLSNNPDKSRALSDAGIKVVARIPCEVTPTAHSLEYLRTKKEKMGHVLALGPLEGAEQPKTSHVDKSNRSAEISYRAPEDEIVFAEIEDAIRELKAGRMVVVVDDEDRENEGDLTMAAANITPEAINFMATHGRGLICLAMTGERLDQLELGPMVPSNSALGGTAFTVSIDARGDGVTTGISAHDRAHTIRTAIDESSDPDDFARPGHVFPLHARAGGVLERRGQTEAAVDLAKLAGLYPAGVICEIVNDDGTMARVPDLVWFCQRHSLLMVTVADLARYRLESEYEEMEGAIDWLFPLSTRDAAIELGHVPRIAPPEYRG
jgi:3,4-dihydroxy-2-butanone 4-phosphate synthase/GTP cyclohydrolase II